MEPSTESVPRRAMRNAFFLAALAVSMVIACTEPAAPCPSGLPRFGGACPNVCEGDPTTQCWADGAVIPDAPRLDAAGHDSGFDAGSDSSIACDGGSVCQGVCTSTASDPNHCGACGRACPAVTNGSATCSAGACSFACASGFHACGNACFDSASPSSCGASCTACAAPAGASPTCVSGACGWTCNAGYEQVGGSCEIRVPRPIAPLSTASVTSQTPGLHWELPAGVDGVSVQLCRDRAMTSMCQMINAVGTSGAPAAALTRGVWFWRLYGRIGGATGTRGGPVWQFTVGARSAPVDTSWGTTLDVNGDGFGDLAVGMPLVNLLSGQVEVFLGSPSGTPSTPAIQLVAPDPGGYFGSAVSSAGDVNGDGFADLLIGAFFFGPSGSAFGRAYLYFGSAIGLPAAPSFVLLATDPGGGFGSSVAGVGDLNNDGYGDVAVGAPHVGRAFVYHGGPHGLSASPTLTLAGPDSAVEFGVSLGGADFNGDGFSDLTVGAPRGVAAIPGRVHAYAGSASGLGSVPVVTLTGPDGNGGHFGESQAAGDFDGDGLADLAVAAPVSMSSAGAVHLFLGSARYFSASAQARVPGPDGAGGAFGTALVIADTNGDGFGDLVVGAPGVPHGVTCRLYGYRGGSSLPGVTPGWSLWGPDAGQFGAAVTGADLTGDGFADVAVGAPDAGATGYDGRAYVYLGNSGGGAPGPSTPLSPAAARGGFGSALTAGH